MCNMSDVRLSNGSPPLERVDARLVDPSRPPVCRRNLFGRTSADSEETHREFLDKMRESQMAFKQKYNFDFEKDKPLAPGNFEWEELGAEDAPEFYSRPQSIHKRVDLNGNSDCQNTRRKRPSSDDPDYAQQSKQVNDCRVTSELTPRKSEPST
ncbi:cyclin-dependent kinase inhibitor 1Ba [Trichomycterus rosablanca]|uniref:cyclin-dependent kinase inhibitor 1Ba n=1 Tax=Trichomycterus rosablanca TaxID=2290929 RepID=UPI002F35AD58